MFGSRWIMARSGYLVPQDLGIDSNQQTVCSGPIVGISILCQHGQGFCQRFVKVGFSTIRRQRSYDGNSESAIR